VVKALIFDYFGVIRPDGLHAAYKKFGGDPVADRKFIHEILEQSNRGKVKSSRQTFAEKFGISVEEWGHEVTGQFNHDPEILAYILQLRNNYKTALLSNIGPGGLQLLWEEGELDKYFDFAAASGDLKYAKPDVEIYKFVAEKLGVKPNKCVMIDDRQLYCDGAKVAGMQFILYKDFEQFKNELELLLKQKSV
jgi:HAD superfamily hydrolase (TIGR01509 family)